MADLNLNFLLKLSPEKAKDYLTKKGFVITSNFDELWQNAHAKAFTVAKIAKLDILQLIKDYLVKAIADGQSYDEFKKSIQPYLISQGWTADPASGDTTNNLRRLKVIYNTNVNIAYATGRYESQMANIDNRPYWQYQAVLDSKTEDFDRSLDGFIAKADDHVWNKIYPPNHWNCRCGVVALSPNEVKANLKANPNAMNAPSQKSIEKSIPPEWQYNPAQIQPNVDVNKYDSKLLKIADL